jgi:hypothetical protein
LFGIGDSISAVDIAVDGLAYIKVIQQAQANGVNNIVNIWNGTAVWSSLDGGITFKTLLGNGFAAARFTLSLKSGLDSRFRDITESKPVFISGNIPFPWQWSIHHSKGSLRRRRFASYSGKWFQQHICENSLPCSEPLLLSVIPVKTYLR